MKNYDHKEIEHKWQKIWQTEGTYRTTHDTSKPKKYILDMFPYPSGEGLHVGHPKGYIATDIISRFYRMNQFNVLHPMGWDAFGLPAEQFAIKNKIHPKLAVDKNVATFKEQLSIIGLDYDWSREVNTTDPTYYKWTQWTFLQMFKKGLAFESHEPINWCPSCKTGLANEDLEDGKCERCGSVVEQKPLRQWVLRITDYADRMLADLDKLDKWPESVKTSQRNWIGKSVGAEIDFPLLIKDENYIIPEFVDEKNPPIEGKPTKERETIHAIVYSKERDAYLTLKWKNHDWHTIIVGGVDEGENIVDSARREVQEETGYTDLVFKGILGGEVRSQYFAAHKDENRVALTTALYFELNSEKKVEVSKEEESLHEVFWLPRNEFNPEEMTNIELPLWFERIKELQKNTVKVFTTRPDTLFGVTYVVLAPEHKLVAELLESGRIQNKEEVENYIEETKNKSSLDRQKSEKTGVELKGIKAINPANGEEVPVWVADYVLAGYGTGAVMAVPAHDERDFEFAKKYDLPIKYVIAPKIIDKDNLPQDGFEYVVRNAAQAIVYNPSNDTYLTLRWKKFDWHSIVLGGIEGEEDIIETAKREVIEETGYTDLVFKKILGSPIISVFHAPHKGINRVSVSSCVLFELASEKQIDLNRDEHEQFDIEWISSEDFFNKPMTNIELPFLRERMLGEIWKPFTEQGTLIESGQFNQMTSEEAKSKITEFVGGKMTTTYKLKDWVFSRQRYWGEPIPLVHAGGKVYPIPESDLPLKLPEVENYEPSDSGESPLADISEWVNVRGFVNDKGEFVVSEDGELEGRRETNTMPQWAGSCWYYLRYIDPSNSEALGDKKLLDYWQPVDVYVGGMEHATRHLIYARFWHKFLFDIGVVSTEEPFTELHATGIVLAEDGRKMSKRWGNVVNPNDMVERFGADALRLYEAFMGPFDDSIAWNTDGLVGTRRFVERVVRIGESLVSKESEVVTRELHKLNKKIASDIPAFKFNTGVSTMMGFVNLVEKEGGITQDSFVQFLKFLAPFAPHITEELWHELGNLRVSEDTTRSDFVKSSIHTSEWPKCDESKLIDDEITIVIQVNGKVRGKIVVPTGLSQSEIEAKAMENPDVKKFVTDTPKKIIYVPNKLINIVI